MATLSVELLERLRDCPRIFDAFDQAAGEELDVQKQLRASFPAELVRGVCTIAALRRRAAGKFSRAHGMWFDRAGLEQATHETVAIHKARRFDGCVWDLCCGIGGDALALAGRGEVIAIDVNPARVRCAEWNGELYGVADRMTVTAGDLSTQDWRGRLVHIDPDRRSRTGGGRARRIEDYVPGLETLRELTDQAAGGAIKVSPASAFGRHFADCEVELVSLDRECREATVWFGRLAGEQRRRATVLPAGVSLAGDPSHARVDTRPLGAYLHDPDPAVVRAGLVNALARELGIGRLDDDEEYLTSDIPVASPFVWSYAVEAVCRADEKRLRRWLSGRNIGRLEIKSRHLPINHEMLRRRLRLNGDNAATLVIARVGGVSTAVLCARKRAEVPASAQENPSEQQKPAAWRPDTC